MYASPQRSEDCKKVFNFSFKKIFYTFLYGGPPNYILIKIKQKRTRELKKVENPWFE